MKIKKIISDEVSVYAIPKEIVYMEDMHNGTPSDTASKKMLEAAGVKTRKMELVTLSVS